DSAGGAPLFVDTSVFLRFLTNDVPEQAAAVEAFFRRAAAGEVRLVTNTMVVAEIVWVLESYYRLARTDVQERAMAVAHMDGLVLPELEIVTDALLAYAESTVDFVDAYNACWVRQLGLCRVATFDKRHYSRFEGIAIHTPGEGPA
ncbi:MAG: PIN domain-containing protein, partial [Thermoleophilia bacterium]|nr:PIN domain-containing protein [Thermoleophilia bacterium]